MMTDMERDFQIRLWKRDKNVKLKMKFKEFRKELDVPEIVAGFKYWEKIYIIVPQGFDWHVVCLTDSELGRDFEMLNDEDTYYACLDMPGAWAPSNVVSEAVMKIIAPNVKLTFLDTVVTMEEWTIEKVIRENGEGKAELGDSLGSDEVTIVE